MPRLHSIVMAMLVFASFPEPAACAPEDCAALIDREARLDCFDRHFPGPVATTDPEPSPIDVRQSLEIASQRNWFSITPHKPNYILPATYNFSSDFSPYGEFGDLFSDVEIKYQLSLKSLVLPRLWRGSSLWFGYTQLSFWQLYADDEASAPFRETNHEPELMWQIPVRFRLFGWDARLASLALNHQSNGRGGPISRSWNRLTGQLVLERGRIVTSLKTWVRVDSPDEDNNPDIEDYMGRIELGAAYRGDRHSFSVGLINNLSSDNRSGVEVNWMFPLAQHLKGYVQVYSGYGESLIDAENYSNRLGVGIALTDWL